MSPRLVSDTTAEAVTGLGQAFRAVLPVPPGDGTDDGLGVDVLVGPDQDRSAVPRAVTVAAAFNGDLDPVTAVRQEVGARPRCIDTITVISSVLVQNSVEFPDRAFAAWKVEAGVILTAVQTALRSPELLDRVARARLLSTRWYDAYDGVGGGQMAIVVDVTIEMVVFS